MNDPTLSRNEGRGINHRGRRHGNHVASSQPERPSQGHRSRKPGREPHSSGLHSSERHSGAAQPQPAALPQPLPQPLVAAALVAGRTTGRASSVLAALVAAIAADLSQQLSQPQPLSQPLLQPLSQPLQRPWPQRLQPLLQPCCNRIVATASRSGSAGGGSSRTVGAGAAQVGAGAAQLGLHSSGQPRHSRSLYCSLVAAVVAQRLWQRDLQHELEQQLVSQPQPLEPSIRSSRSKLKPGVQTARPSTNDPRSEVRFIERRLLNDGTIELAHVPVRPDHVSAGGRARGRGRQRHVGPILSAVPLPRRILRGVRVRVGQVCGKAGSLSHTETRCRAPEPVRANRWPEKVRSGSPDADRTDHLHGAFH